MKAEPKKMSRRGFGRLLAVTPLGAAATRPVPQAQPLSREEELRAARDRRMAASLSLAKLDVPMATEPAFVFRP